MILKSCITITTHYDQGVTLKQVTFPLQQAAKAFWLHVVKTVWSDGKFPKLLTVVRLSKLSVHCSLMKVLYEEREKGNVLVEHAVDINSTVFTFNTLRCVIIGQRSIHTDHWLYLYHVLFFNSHFQVREMAWTSSFCWTCTLKSKLDQSKIMCVFSKVTI